MHCPNCGQAIADDSAFCPHCGAPQAGSGDGSQAEAFAAAAQAEPQVEQQAYEQNQTYQQSQGYQQNQTYQQSQGYQQSQAYQQAPVNDTKAIVALCCGVFSLITLFTGWGTLLGVAAAIVGLVMGVKARKENPCTMATVGVILCTCGLVICALVFLACVACVGGVGLLSAMG